jgi:hypothetical protein
MGSAYTARFVLFMRSTLLSSNSVRAEQGRTRMIIFTSCTAAGWLASVLLAWGACAAAALLDGSASFSDRG